MPEIFNLDI